MIFIGGDDRADSSAITAGCTLLFIYKARPLADAHLEIAHVTRNIFDLRVGQEFDFGMSTDIHHFGAKNSDATFDIRVHLIQLRHDATDGGFFLHQVNLVTGISQIQGGLDASNSAANDQRGIRY